MISDSSRINVAVVGCGMLAQGAHLPNVLKNPRLNLSWCCDLSKETLETVKEKFSPDKVTVDPAEVAKDKDCQVVIICTHHNVRKELIMLFARAGKHIYAEKPMANDMEEVREICKVIKETGVGFCLGHNRRCAPAIQQARKIYLKHKANPVNPAWRWDREALGGPDNEWDKRTFILIRVNDDAFSWKQWCFEEGLLYCEMTHFVDLAYYMTGLKPASVTVIGDPSTNYSLASINIEFEEGSLATIVTTANGTFGYPKELIEIYYGGAAIVVDHCVEVRTAGIKDEPFYQTFPLDRDPYPQIHTDGGIKDYYLKTIAMHQDVANGTRDHGVPPWPNKGHYEMLDSFIEAALSGKPGPSDVVSSAISTSMILKVVESAEAGGEKKKIETDFLK